MKIPFLDLKSGYLELQAEIDAAIKRVLNSGWYILGSEVEAFEAEEFVNYYEANYCVGVANSQDAFHLLLLSLGVSQTMKSSCGEIPACVEPDPLTYNLITSS